MTSPSGHQLFLWPQQTLGFFSPDTEGPTSASLAARMESQASGGVGPKLITVSIDSALPIPPLSLCRGALSQGRRLCGGLQRRWDFTKIERTKKCDKLQ